MQEVYPFLETHDLYGGQWDPLDGDIDPAQLTQALAKGARDMGARIIRFCPVTGVRRENGEWVLSTPQGEIRCEYVVNATGYRANEVGAMFGRNVPCVSLAHQYLITEGIPELAERDRKLPLLRDPDSSYYLRQEKDGLLLGPYEKNCRAHWTTADDPTAGGFLLPALFRRSGTPRMVHRRRLCPCAASWHRWHHPGGERADPLRP